jgi:hypothetical protein
VRSAWELLINRGIYSSTGTGATSNMHKREIEDLARALAHHNRRRWRTMPARAHAGSDANGGREAWLRRARIILEAVETAMIAAFKRRDHE